eukprot:317775-Amphidinium_carterae.1
MAQPKAVDLCEKQAARYCELCKESQCSTNSAVIAALSVPNPSGVYDFSRTLLGDLQFRPLAASLSIDTNLTA